MEVLRAIDENIRVVPWILNGPLQVGTLGLKIMGDCYSLYNPCRSCQGLNWVISYPSFYYHLPDNTMKDTCEEILFEAQVAKNHYDFLAKLTHLRNDHEYVSALAKAEKDLKVQEKILSGWFVWRP